MTDTVNPDRSLRLRLQNAGQSIRSDSFGSPHVGIYVEILIRAPIDEIWRATQTPELHARWDLRFTGIAYLPRAGEAEPQRFLYTTRIGFGLAIQGEGETVGRRDGTHGERTSALSFWSRDPKSLIREGAGYWRYVPTERGVRFLTYYDYRVRFGPVGRAFDGIVFRRLLGWATAWSFDRLRLWIDGGIDPAVSLQRSAIHCVARCTVALVWLYQGAIPKLLFHNADEMAMLRQGGISAASASVMVQIAGWLELTFGLAMLLRFRDRWHFVLSIILMIAATFGVAICSPQFLSQAFNPISLNLLMIALASVGLMASRHLPSASHCLRKPPKSSP